MKVLSVIVLVGIGSVMLPLITVARMNETESQMKSRYGAPVDTPATAINPLLEGAVNHVYDYEGWRIRAAFLKERVVRISYSKKAKPNMSPIIADDEIKAVLDAEAGKGKWEELGKLQPKPLKSLPWAVSNKAWVHSNGNVACQFLSKLMITIDSPAVDAYLAEGAAEKEARRKASIPKF